MNDDFRTLLQEELSSVGEPAMGNLVHDSVRQGKRMRTVRMIYRSGVTSGLAVLLTAAVVAHPWSSGGSGASIQAVGPAAQSVTGRTVPSTPEGLLELVLQDLPPGTTSHYAKSDPADKTSKTTQYQDMAQVYLDAGAGPGMIRVFIEPPLKPIANQPTPTGAEAERLKGLEKQKLDAAKKQDLASQVVTKRGKLPDGRTYSVSDNKTNCVGSLFVTVSRAAGYDVAVQASTCLEWNGKTNEPGQLSLTAEQALKIASDPRIDKQLPADAVVKGAQDFPDLRIMG
jgi:hypothetical protein